MYVIHENGSFLFRTDEARLAYRLSGAPGRVLYREAIDGQFRPVNRDDLLADYRQPTGPR